MWYRQVLSDMQSFLAAVATNKQDKKISSSSLIKQETQTVAEWNINADILDRTYESKKKK